MSLFKDTEVLEIWENGERKPLKFRFHWEKWSITIPTVKFWTEFAVPTGYFGLKTMKINIPCYKIKGIFIPTGIFLLNFIPADYKFSTGSVIVRGQGSERWHRMYMYKHISKLMVLSTPEAKGHEGLFVKAGWNIFIIFKKLTLLT